MTTTQSELSQWLNRDIPNTSLLLIEKHEHLIRILEMIKQLERRKRDCKDNYFPVQGWFPELARKYHHRYHILDKAIQRVWQRYHKELDKPVEL